MIEHRTYVGRGSAGKYFVSCDACDFNPEWSPLLADAERWAREHVEHPDRDVSGIWASSRWRFVDVDGMNHAYPFGAPACGVGGWRDDDDIGHAPLGTEAEPQAATCPRCEAMAPLDRDRA